MRTALLVLGGALICTSSANAALVITEVMSSSLHTSGGPTDGDWWELTNTGLGSVNLNGYRWNDNSGGFSSDEAIFGNFTISAGESILIVDESATNIAAWQSAWGLAASVQTLANTDMTGPNVFSGLSSGGDQVNLWDSAGTLLSSVTFGATAAGVSFEWDTAGNSLNQSVSGENGAYTSTIGGTDVGSPGVAVPAPGAAALLSLAGLIAVRRRRR